MSHVDWDASLKNLLVHEGGKVDDPQDPGGRTNRGVTQATFSGWLRAHGKPVRDVFTITDDEVQQIYWAQYAQPVHFDEAPAGVDYVLFDGAVNSGVVQSIKWLQKALGSVAVDGHFGALTKAALDSYGDYDRLIEAMLDARLAFDKALKTWGRFGNGWTARISDVRAIAQNWAVGSIGPEPKYVDGAHAKALLVDARTVGGQGLGAAGAGIGAAATGVTQVSNMLAPAADKVPAFATVVTVLTVIGALLAVAGFLWFNYAKQRQAQLESALDRTPATYSHEDDEALADPEPAPVQEAPAPAAPAPEPVPAAPAVTAPAPVQEAAAAPTPAPAPAAPEPVQAAPAAPVANPPAAAPAVSAFATK